MKGNCHAWRTVIGVAAVSRTAGAQGNEACWRVGFSYDLCCKPPGNPDCFDSMYTYEACCLNDQGGSQLPQDCHRSEELDRLPRNVQCRGTKWVTADEWGGFFWAHQLSQALGTSFLGWPNVTALLQKANHSLLARHASEEDCIFGFAAVVLHSLPHIERSEGSAAARRAHSYVYRLLQQASGSEDCRWLQMVNHDMFDHYDLLMSMEGRFQGWCPAGAPRVYVYDTKDLADRPLSCARIGFWGSEVYVDRFLRQSGCRTRDPEDADLLPGSTWRAGPLPPSVDMDLLENCRQVLHPALPDLLGAPGRQRPL